MSDKVRTSGSVVRGNRKALGLTIKELSFITGILETNISSYENDRKPIGFHVALKFAAALGISPQTILYPRKGIPLDNSEDLEEIKRKANIVLQGKK